MEQEQVPDRKYPPDQVQNLRLRGRDVTVHVFPDAGHRLIQTPPPSAPFDWPRLPAGYLPAVVAWLQTRVFRRR